MSKKTLRWILLSIGMILIILAFMIVVNCAHNGTNSFITDNTFDPITEAKGYNLWFFHLKPGQNVDIGSNIAQIEDTLSISFHQPKSRGLIQDTAIFHIHDDTLVKFIQNDISLYPYYPKDDSAIYIHGTVDFEQGGIYELSVSCMDTLDYESNLSRPVLFMLGDVPSQAIDVNIIIRRKR